MFIWTQPRWQVPATPPPTRTFGETQRMLYSCYTFEGSSTSTQTEICLGPTDLAPLITHDRSSVPSYPDSYGSAAVHRCSNHRRQRGNTCTLHVLSYAFRDSAIRRRLQRLVTAFDNARLVSHYALCVWRKSDGTPNAS
jgi:hypothetical protein